MDTYFVVIDSHLHPSILYGDSRLKFLLVLREDAQFAVDGSHVFANVFQLGEVPGGAEAQQMPVTIRVRGAPSQWARPPAIRLPKGAMPTKAIV